MDEDKDICNKHNLFTVSSAFPWSLFSLDSLKKDQQASEVITSSLPVSYPPCPAGRFMVNLANPSPLSLDSKIILWLLSVLRSLDKKNECSNCGSAPHLCGRLGRANRCCEVDGQQPVQHVCRLCDQITISLPNNKRHIEPNHFPFHIWFFFLVYDSCQAQAERLTLSVISEP